MGLCKCRTVTNLFCFEHRKNVCENCLVTDHQRCVVRSYLQWLQDSDFDPQCVLCRQPLAQGDVIRLACLDLFHTQCVQNQCDALPENTAAAGYACTICNQSIIPQPNNVSPIAVGIRKAFKDTSWMKRSQLGVMTISTTPITPSRSSGRPVKASSPLAVNTSIISSDTTALSPNGDVSISMTSPKRVADADEHKYERRNHPIMTGSGGLSSLLRRFTKVPVRLRRLMSSKVFWLIVIIICLFLIIYMGSYRRGDDVILPVKPAGTSSTKTFKREKREYEYSKI